MKRYAVLFSFCVAAISGCGSATGGQTCPSFCPATSSSATIVVMTVPAMALDGVEATLSGPVSGTMSCVPNVSAILCAWPRGVAVVPGTYSIEVSAPGYEAATLGVEVTVSPPSCGCTSGDIQPSTVTLTPAGAG
jgi:hypothetical protein